MEVIEGQSHHLNSSPGFPPRIGIRGRLFAGITMALRRPHKRMKIARCRGSLAGKKLLRYGVPHPWTPAPYRGTGPE